MIATLAFGGVRGVFVGLALFALLAHAGLLVDARLPAATLPLCLAIGAAAFVWRSRRERAEPPASAPRWLLWTTFAVISLCGFAVAYGAIATPARAWDGIVAWEMKANALAEQASLLHPFFADPAVFHHSPSYPLLQPLCLASLGQWLGTAGARVLFPLLWVGFVLTGGLAVTRRTGDARRGTWVALALATTPFFVNTNGGGADSGYAEMFFAFALTGVAAGLLLRDAWLLLAATILLPLLKPEGTIMVLLVPLTCFVACNRRWWWPAVIGASIALAAWLPLQSRLDHRPAGGGGLGLVAALTVAIAFGPIGLRWLLDRLGAPVRARVMIAIVGAVGGAVALWLLPREATGSALGQFVAGSDRIAAKASELHTILLGLAGYGLAPRRFGLTFVLLGIAVYVLLRHRRGIASLPAAALFVAWGPLVVLAACLLSPEPVVEHHLRSSAPRLISHWVGAAWVVIGAVWGGAGDRSSDTATGQLG